MSLSDVVGEGKTLTLRFRPNSAKPETKNCFRYEEVPNSGQPPVIGTLYVQKWAMPKQDELSVVLHFKP